MEDAPDSIYHQNKMGKNYLSTCKLYEENVLYLMKPGSLPSLDLLIRRCIVGRIRLRPSYELSRNNQQFQRIILHTTVEEPKLTTTNMKDDSMEEMLQDHDRPGLHFSEKTLSNLSVPPDLSRKIAILSFLAACSVVIIHTRSRAVRLTDSLSVQWIHFFISKAMTSYAVPLFFSISGYLLAVKSDLGKGNRWYSQILKKRTKSLLIPYLIWCTIYAVTFVPFKVIGNYLAGRDLLLHTFISHPFFSIGTVAEIYGLDISNVPAGMILWYVRNLMLLLLISPLFFLLFKKHIVAILFLLLSTLLLMSEYKLHYKYFFDYGFSLEGLFYFPLGIYFALYPLPKHSFKTLRCSPKTGQVDKV